MRLTVINIILIVATIFLIGTGVLASTDSTFKKIVSSDYGTINEIKSIRDSIHFSGYIVFEIPKNYRFIDSKDYKDYFETKVYFVNSLKNLFDSEDILLYDSYLIYLSSFSDLVKFRNSGNIDEIKFISFYENYMNNYKLNYTKRAFLFSSLSTIIFYKDIKLWTKSVNDSVSYYVFNLSTIATVIEMNREIMINNTQKEYKDLKFIYPLNKSCHFEPVVDSLMLSNGFTMSNLNVDFLFNVNE